MSLASWLLGRMLKLPPASADKSKIQVQRDLSIPMRDGIALLADRWSAADHSGQPLVLVRSPYGRSALFGLVARLFAERGFQVLLQSCRGTGGSGGQLDPMRQEQADGLDTIAWIRMQPWFGGRLYTYGMSYLGYTQWAIAGEGGKHVDAMALQVTLSNFRNETLAFGGFTLAGSLEWTTLMNTMDTGHPLLKRLFGRHKRTPVSQLHAHLPLQEIDTLALGKQVSWWQDWLRHGEPTDPWWEAVDHSADAADVAVPVTMIGGWRDIFLPWQVQDFERMQAQGRDVWLTIGPWSHAAVAGMGEGLRQALSLFSAHSRGQRPLVDRGRVRLYVNGANEWRDYDAWPPPGSNLQRFYLAGAGGLAADAPSAASASSFYTYDPSDPTPAVHGPKLMGGAKKPDMAELEKRPDSISFTTAPLSSDLEVVGPVSVDVYIRSDRQHTDFYACLCEVDAAGRALQVLDGYLRLRPGEPVEDAESVRHILINCWPTAHRFARGHQLRLILASGAHPRYARNLGTGEPVGSGTRMVPAHQQIFHDAAHPSSLCLTLSPTKPQPGAGSVQ